MTANPFSGKTLAVMLGGTAAERRISLESGENVARALEQAGAQVLRALASGEIDPTESLPRAVRAHYAVAVRVAGGVGVKMPRHASGQLFLPDTCAANLRTYVESWPRHLTRFLQLLSLSHSPSNATYTFHNPCIS